jgi:hypothetical protein
VRHERVEDLAAAAVQLSQEEVAPLEEQAVEVEPLAQL